MTTDFRPARWRDDLPSVERLLSLSDNVIAFALTLLVLQVTVPPLSQVADPTSAADLAAQLARQAGHLVSYVIAFYIIAQFWLTHRRVFRHAVGHRDSLAWWNFAFLATITIMPFTSSLLGEYPSNPLAVDIFAANLLLAVLATRAMFVLGRRWDLLAGDVNRPGGMGAAGAGGRDRDGCRLVGRPGVGEHHSGQVLLGADPCRAVGRGAPVRTAHLTQRPTRCTWPVAANGQRPGLSGRT